MRLPNRSTDNVRTWLIFAHDRFGNFGDVNSSVSGKCAFGSLLVTATVITVPDRSLKTSWLKTNTGLRPACSFPFVGSSSAHYHIAS